MAFVDGAALPMAHCRRKRRMVAVSSRLLLSDGAWRQRYSWLDGAMARWTTAWRRRLKARRAGGSFTGITIKNIFYTLSPPLLCGAEAGLCWLHTQHALAAGETLRASWHFFLLLPFSSAIVIGGRLATNILRYCHNLSLSSASAGA
jgi:hypothetical protein